MGTHRDVTATPLVGAGIRAGDVDGVLEDALLPGGVVAYVQCIVDLARGTIVGYEALARFRRAAQESPAGVFAAARNRGRLTRLEAATLRAGIARLDTLPADTFLTVNVSPEVLATREVREVLEERGSLRRVVFDLTEHSGVDLGTQLLDTLGELRASGARVAVDHGGTTYTRLHDLQALRPDILMLDRAMVSGVDRDPTRRMQIELVANLACQLDAQLLAEGVETLAELDTISRLGVHLAQGFLLARPAPEWPIVREQTTALLQTIAAQHGGATLVDLLQQAPTTTSLGHGERAPRGEVLVVLDAEHRPASIIDELGRVLGVEQSTGTVKVRSQVTAAARYATSRPGPTRFLPLVCTDDGGRYVGVVRVDAVLAHLASR
ncbi:EAL domain-containing protein [Nocardioides mangrovicus]|nr:EAL domain-containing protein [Nocardioides mangrovicus]